MTPLLRLHYIDKHNIISKNQYGFQTGKSTDDALVKVVDEVHDAISKTTPCVAIFLDLAKAFDTVNHKFLLQKLYALGFRGKAHDLLRSYLTNTKQIVKIDDVYSDEMRVRCGVPQGTILGPILFILYINSMLMMDVGCEIVSFADDTVLIVKGETWEQAITTANVMINKVKKWVSQNHLSLNVDKTVYMTFGSYRNSLPLNTNITTHTLNCDPRTCDCSQIKRVSHTKYLGVIVDSNLNWTEHVNKVVQKSRFMIYLVYKLKPILTSKQLLTIYYGLFWSIVTYGIVVWGGTHDVSISPLLTIQKKLVKLIFNKPPFYSSEDLYKEKCIISVRKYFIEKSIFRNFSSLQSAYEQLRENSSRRRIVQAPKVLKQIDRRNHKYIGNKTFNLLPDELKKKQVSSLINAKLIRKWIIDLSPPTIKGLFRPDM